MFLVHNVNLYIHIRTPKSLLLCKKTCIRVSFIDSVYFWLMCWHPRVTSYKRMNVRERYFLKRNERACLSTRMECWSFEVFRTSNLQRCLILCRIFSTYIKFNYIKASFQNPLSILKVTQKSYVTLRHSVWIEINWLMCERKDRRYKPRRSLSLL